MSLHTFTENVIVLAVENCLLRKIPSIFEPSVVVRMDDEQLASLGGETERSRNEREDLTSSPT